MNLTWYKNIEPLLKIDNIYHLDHVSVHKILNPKQYPKQDKPKSNKLYSEKFEKTLAGYNKMNPLPSKKFRVQDIFKNLLKKFDECWEHDKKSSSKLSFYNTCKLKFGKESYLYCTKGFSRRSNTTKLRISAHDLEVERGRFKKLPRESRTCHWCKTSMGIDIVEDENHLLFDCDFYAILRSKLITQLNNLPQLPVSIMQLLNLNNTSHVITYNLNNLKYMFHDLLSQFTHTNTNKLTATQINIHHQTYTNVKPASTILVHEQMKYRHSYIINCLCTYIMRCFEKRSHYFKQLKDENVIKKIIMYFT